MPRRLIIDAHEWINEIPAVPRCWLVNQPPREQQCRTPQCPLHDLHAGALCASHRVCMGRPCPTLLVPARCAVGGRGGWGSLLLVACGAAPFGAEAPTPASRVGCTSATSCGGKGEGRGGRRLVPPPSCRLLPLPPLLPLGAVGVEGHEATDTGLAYAPVSQAHGHHHTVQCCALLHCSATTPGGCRLCFGLGHLYTWVSSHPPPSHSAG